MLLRSKVALASVDNQVLVRRLQADGDIRGYRVDLDFDRVAPLQALISVRLAKHVRGEVDRFREEAPTWPGVRSLFHMAGAEDYLLHVAANSATDLRDFVLRYLASHPAVKRTQTNLIFEHADGTGWLDLLDP